MSDDDSTSEPGLGAGQPNDAAAGVQAPTPAPGPPVLNILDAVCVLFFGASGQIDVLVQILNQAGFVLLIPQEVLDEARRRAGQNKWRLLSLDAHVAPGAAIQVIPAIDATQASTFTLLAQVRGRHPNALAATTPTSTPSVGNHPDEDLGECVVVTQALEAQRRGFDVRVAIDDLKGQTLAARHNLRNFTIEDAFSAALEHEVLTMLEARAVYERLRPFGGSLPTWDAVLRPRLRREKNARARARQAARKAESTEG